MSDNEGVPSHNLVLSDFVGFLIRNLDSLNPGNTLKINRFSKSKS